MAKVVRAAGQPMFAARRAAGQPTMHDTVGEFRLMSGKGSLIKQDGTRARVTGEKPRGRRK